MNHGKLTEHAMLIKGSEPISSSDGNVSGPSVSLRRAPFHVSVCRISVNRNVRVFPKTLLKNIGEIFIFAVISILTLSVRGVAGEPLVQNDSAKTNQRSDTANQPQDLSLRDKPQSPVSANKRNYFSINQWPGNNNAQIKFQISMKFQLLEPNLYVFKYDLFPAFISYTQKSLWNIGQNSSPFEESDYNPELFLDYPVNAGIFGRIKLRSIIISPMEHESNGLSGIQSRSWNRQYVLIRFGLESNEKPEKENSSPPDKVILYVKLWHASGYSDQDDYLQSIGRNNKFLDYMGQGEIGISIKNFLWGGSFKDHQLDIRTPIFRDSQKESCEFEFHQQLPNMNFALYLQYWYGYGETLLRFDQFGHRGFIGLSFSY